ncbi:hypothetical protein EYF80_016071 [Liparis tanakae]|uniref:Uncharacterized protein n=1 Tax=Liparis tanakae TaxID=230148 RepID=A0A4Z2I7E2_9TELE|nr:hypothetical protein EYF80_016071 [Liparis tanakae]
MLVLVAPRGIMKPGRRSPSGLSENTRTNQNQTATTVTEMGCFCWMIICNHANDSLLSIQKMTGGGSPAGGRHCSTRETPTCTAIASFLSFDHKGDPASHITVKQRYWRLPTQ